MIRLWLKVLFVLGAMPVVARAVDCRVLAIGNSSYSQHPLRNPINDAHAVAAALRIWGCQVEVETNVTTEELRRSVRRFAASDAKPAILYLAGHGFVDEAGEQRIVGVRGIPGDAADTVTLRDLQEILEAGTLHPILILDTCRTPKSGAKALTPKTDKAMVVTSASIGEAALDQPEDLLGLFAEHFVLALRTEFEFTAACHKAQSAVTAASNGRQRPDIVNPIQWRRPRIQPTLVSNATHALIEIWRGSTANEIVRTCSLRGGRLPKATELPILGSVGAVWTENVDGKGSCGAWGGQWHPSLGSPQALRWFPCDKVQSTISAVCLLPGYSAALVSQ